MPPTPPTAVATPPASALKGIPALDRLLRLSASAALIDRYGRTFVTDEARAMLAGLRDAVLAGETVSLDDESVAKRLDERVGLAMAPAQRPVFNLTGTVLHTNLGRAILADEAIAAVVATSGTASNVEFDLDSGERGDRDTLVEKRLCALTGAEAATVVNNNAAAVLLTLAALASKREVIVSRGELVEIGGAFRMPDVMQCAGAKMVEVGTTNRTHPGDYAGAIGPRTALLLKVHTSNYEVRGFTSSVDESTLADLAHRAGLPLAVDLGSGSLADLAQHGLPAEPMPRQLIERGADVVMFSGDKLLGGPQAGLIVGRADLIRRIKKHPLKRALRVSKLTLAALEGTLALYAHPESLARRLPTLRLLTREPGEIEALARRVAPALTRALAPAFDVSVAAVRSQIGSGSLPVDTLPSFALVARPAASRGKAGSGRNLVALGTALRALPVPVVGRVADGALWLDLRTLLDEPGFVGQLALLKVRGARA